MSLCNLSMKIIMIITTNSCYLNTSNNIEISISENNNIHNYNNNTKCTTDITNAAYSNNIKIKP